MALPNAMLTFALATLVTQDDLEDLWDPEKTTEAAQIVTGVFTVIMLFILQNRSRTSYNRWWEGGTLIQKTRGEWFNAYSSIMSFTSNKPELRDRVVAYQHLLARLMSLLMCCGLQQVSPNRDRPFEIVDLDGIDPESMDFLNHAPDKVEVILQWIQRGMILHVESGVLPVAPPILSRAFQEVSRGIVNLQNARKIADFPYPYPLAQISMILQILHWVTTPFVATLALPRGWACLYSFISTFVLWCIHFNALDLEFPFGSRVNDLPMNEFQQDWNRSLLTLLDAKGIDPPSFRYDSQVHDQLCLVMSDATELFVQSARSNPMTRQRAIVSIIKVAPPGTRGRRSPTPRRTVGAVPMVPHLHRSFSKQSDESAPAAVDVSSGALDAPLSATGNWREDLSRQSHSHDRPQPLQSQDIRAGSSAASPILIGESGLRIREQLSEVNAALALDALQDALPSKDKTIDLDQLCGSRRTSANVVPSPRGAEAKVVADPDEDNLWPESPRSLPIPGDFETGEQSALIAGPMSARNMSMNIVSNETAI